MWVWQKLVWFLLGGSTFIPHLFQVVWIWAVLLALLHRGAGKKAEHSDLCEYIKIYLQFKLKPFWFSLNFVQDRAGLRAWGAWGSSSPGSALQLFYRRQNQVFRVKILPLSPSLELQTASPQWCAVNISLWLSVPWEKIELRSYCGKKNCLISLLV